MDMGGPVIQPRMTAGELALFDYCVSAARSYLEFGAGGTTVRSLELGVDRLDCVETDPSWVKRIRATPQVQFAENAGRVEFHLVDVGPLREWGYPADQSHIRNWPEYSLGIWSRIKAPPDIVLIDGRFRTAVALASMLFLPSSSTILVHDFDLQDPIRANYERIVEFADIVEKVESLFVMKRKAALLQARALSVLAQTLLDPA